jgi:hypothetical protein
MPNLIMGTLTTSIRTAAVLFADGTTQLTAATPAPPTPVTNTARVDMGTIASATPSLVTVYMWPTPFADNNYTIIGSVEILETPPAAATTEIICIGSIHKKAAGAGFNFVVCNASSGAHHVIANFIAIHD